MNERLEELNLGFEPILPLGDWVCECPDRDRLEHIHLTLREFAAVREGRWRFVVKPGHEAIRGAALVRGGERYVVVT